MNDGPAVEQHSDVDEILKFSIFEDFTKPVSSKVTNN
jgi:hypothetical protein